mmetsp:Transcript_92478/g.298924  ORF Transcript_92478/g.298924 Transcript_92478/m.298924 type:complete len:332 (-) Transcript_92478:59-1054(-)
MELPTHDIALRSVKHSIFVCWGTAPSSQQPQNRIGEPLYVETSACRVPSMLDACSAGGFPGLLSSPYSNRPFAGGLARVPQPPLPPPGLGDCWPMHQQHQPPPTFQPTQCLPPADGQGAAATCAQEANLRLHAQGKCVPCRFFSLKHGCRNGATCGFCHICKPKPDEREGPGAKSRRPCKGKRDRYKKLVDRLIAQCDDEAHIFDIDGIKLPEAVMGDDRLHSKLRARLHMYKERRCLEVIPACRFWVGPDAGTDSATAEGTTIANTSPEDTSEDEVGDTYLSTISFNSGRQQDEAKQPTGRTEAQQPNGCRLDAESYYRGSWSMPILHGS